MDLYREKAVKVNECNRDENGNLFLTVTASDVNNDTLDYPVLILDRRIPLKQLPLMILLLKTITLPPGEENDRLQKKMETK
jgi:hypothetical protein